MQIKPPYCLFIGDAQEPFSIKMASGVAHWRPELVVGEFALEDCKVTTSMPRLSIEEAARLGAKTFVLGFANNGGTIENKWIPFILKAIEAGMDIVSGLHQKLTSIKKIESHAKKFKVNLFDIRHPTQTFKTGTGYKRSGKRLLTVGTDCSTGKMFTALALEREMKKTGLNVSFKATGQSGILISGQGIAIDCVVSDFIAGAVEQLSPDNSEDHWDIIEGQGSLFHPAFAGVSMGLIHGAQPNALVLCHIAKREHMRGIPGRDLPSIKATMEMNLKAAKLTNPNVKFVGMSINTSMLSENEAIKVCNDFEKRLNLPCVDPLRHGVSKIVDNLNE